MVYVLYNNYNMAAKDSNEQRLQKRRETDKRRRDAETPEEQRAMLDQQKAYQQKRINF